MRELFPVSLCFPWKRHRAYTSVEVKPHHVKSVGTVWSSAELQEDRLHSFFSSVQELGDSLCLPVHIKYQSEFAFLHFGKGGEELCWE